MSNLVGKYDIGGVLDRFRARYGEQYLKSDNFQGHLEDFMDSDDPDRELMIMFRTSWKTAIVSGWNQKRLTAS